MNSIKAMLITFGFVILGLAVIALGAIVVPFIIALVLALIAGALIYFVYIIVLEATREQ